MKITEFITSPLPYFVVVVVIIVLLVTGNLFSLSPVVMGVQVVAAGLNVWARFTFQGNTFQVAAVPVAPAVIRHGPYRFVRHPMYSAALLFIWAGVLSHLSLFTLVTGIAVTAMCIFRVIAEERLLRNKYPDYADYSRATKSLIPFVY